MRLARPEEKGQTTNSSYFPLPTQKHTGTNLYSLSLSLSLGSCLAQPRPSTTLTHQGTMLNEFASIAVEQLLTAATSSTDTDGASIKPAPIEAIRAYRQLSERTAGLELDRPTVPQRRLPMLLDEPGSYKPVATTTAVPSLGTQEKRRSSGNSSSSSKKRNSTAITTTTTTATKAAKKRRTTLTPEERRMKRIMANRKSARTSRERRKKLVTERKALAAKLVVANQELMRSNLKLRADVMELQSYARTVATFRGRSFPPATRARSPVSTMAVPGGTPPRVYSPPKGPSPIAPRLNGHAPMPPPMQMHGHANAQMQMPTFPQGPTEFHPQRQMQQQQQQPQMQMHSRMPMQMQMRMAGGGGGGDDCAFRRDDISVNNAGSNTGRGLSNATRAEMLASISDNQLLSWATNARQTPVSPGRRQSFDAPVSPPQPSGLPWQISV